MVRYENRYYACTGYIQFRDCDCPSVRQDVVEQVVVTHLLPLLDEAELNRRITVRLGARVTLLKQEGAAIESRLAEVDPQLTRVRHDYRQAKIDADTFTELRTEIEAEKGTLVQTLTEKRAALATAESGAWQNLTFPQKKQVIHRLTARVEWDFRTRRITVRTAI